MEVAFGVARLSARVKPGLDKKQSSEMGGELVPAAKQIHDNLAGQKPELWVDLRRRQYIKDRICTRHTPLARHTASMIKSNAHKPTPSLSTPLISSASFRDPDHRLSRKQNPRKNQTKTTRQIASGPEEPSHTFPKTQRHSTPSMLPNPHPSTHPHPSPIHRPPTLSLPSPSPPPLRPRPPALALPIPKTLPLHNNRHHRRPRRSKDDDAS